MSLFSWLFNGRRRASIFTIQPVAYITNGPHTYAVDVIGESRHQKALKNICGSRAKRSHRLQVEAYLVPKDNDPRDSKAVHVYIQNKSVGYVDSYTARRFRKQMAMAGMKNTIAKCRAIIVGSWDRGPQDRGHFAVKLDLPTD